MTKYLESVNRELKHSFYTGTRKNDYHAARIHDVSKVIVKGLEQRTPFRKNWVELFAIFPEQESLRCMQRIYKVNGLPIPADLAPVDDSL